MCEISIIIPVYNAQDYLKRCLNSVLNQKFKDFEAICINDGSTDSSFEILREYSKKDSRIKVIGFNQNQGASIARNTGIKEARGKYLGFMDCDESRIVAMSFCEPRS